MQCAGLKRAAEPAGGWRFISFGVLIALVAGLFLLASPPASAQFATGPNQGIAGEWDWGAGGSGNVVVIWGNGTGRGGEGNALQWTLVDPIARHYRLVWSNSRFIDDAELSVDGNTLLIVNNDGVRFTATRRGASGTVVPIVPVQPPGAGGANQGIAGEWDWGAGGSGSGNVVVIWGNGMGSDSAGNTMQWQLLDPIARRYRLTWSHGFVDEGDLTVDGQRLLLVNNVGTRFVGTRRTGSGIAGGPTPPAPPAPPPGGEQAGGYLPAGQDSYDSTSTSSGDPFNGGTWSNAQNGRAFAQRYMMPPVCISGFTLESAGSDMSTRGATIRIDLISPYGGHFNALDLRAVAVNRDFSPGGSGRVVPAQSADFPPFETSRIDVEMRGHGWFLMKGLRFDVVPCR